MRRTGRSYLDGAFYHNNPVHIAAQERKLIWPGTASCPPDILISIGTGYDPTPADSDAQKSNEPNEAKDRGRFREHFQKKPRIPLLKLLIARLNNALDCNRIWDEFLANEPRPPSPGRSHHCFYRFNPRLQGDCPKLDEKEKLNKLQGFVKKWLAGQGETQLVKQVARQLVASCFYFDRLKTWPVQSSDDEHVQGIWAIQQLQNTFYSLC
jgi:hypothetical protein